MHHMNSVIQSHNINSYADTVSGRSRHFVLPFLRRVIRSKSVAAQRNIRSGKVIAYAELVDLINIFAVKYVGNLDEIFIHRRFAVCFGHFFLIIIAKHNERSLNRDCYGNNNGKNGYQDRLPDCHRSWFFLRFFGIRLRHGTAAFSK